MRGWAWSAGMIALAGVLAGCGSIIGFEGNSGSTGGGDGGTGGSGGTGGTGPSSTGVGADGGAGGSGEGQPCLAAYEVVDIGVSTQDGGAFGCTLGTTGSVDMTLQGAVVSSNQSLTEIDTCPPNADCAPTLAQIIIAASGLFAYLPVGAFVEVELRIVQSGVCTSAILVRSIDSWGGVPNPAGPGGQLWVAAADGMADTVEGAPFAVSRELVCGDPAVMDAKSYALRFTDPGDPGGASTVIDQGQSGMWSPPSNPAAGTWLIKNLRSFESGYFDSYWDWAYWITPAPIPD
jgi:hypothetical protein